MSISALTRAIGGLPRNMVDSVVSYARSVEAALPEIFREAGIKYRKNIAEEVIFVAGIKKLFATVDSTYWMLENSKVLLERQQVTEVRIGSSDLYGNGRELDTLRQLRTDFLELLEQNNLTDIVDESSYSSIIRKLVDERTSN
jgi:uncharacterized protein (DUF1499 family)